MLFVLQAIVALILGVSAFLLWLVFPRGYFPARLLWVDIHRWGGLSLGILVLVHVLLHWEWLFRMTGRYVTSWRGGRSRRPDVSPICSASLSRRAMYHSCEGVEKE